MTKAVLLTLLLILSTQIPAHAEKSSCLNALFSHPGKAAADFSVYSPASQGLILKFEIRPVPEKMMGLEMRWVSLSHQAHQTNWLSILNHLSENSPAVFEQYNLKRTGSSQTLRGDEKYARGWRKAEALTRAWVARRQPITLEKIIQLNKTIGFAFKDGAKKPGVLRRTAKDKLNTVFSVFDPTDVERGMNDLLTWYNYWQTRLNTFELATLFYQRFVTIHPFFNGNGRTARLVTDWILLSKGFPPMAFEGSSSVQRSTVEGRDLEVEVSLTRVTDAVENSMNFLTN